MLQQIFQRPEGQITLGIWRAPKTGRLEFVTACKRDNKERRLKMNTAQLHLIEPSDNTMDRRKLRWFPVCTKGRNSSQKSIISVDKQSLVDDFDKQSINK
uniref:Uncharacterized protein n=1 Tax=Romanomermis culicivorax TaxID=13658 RepID=A0A915KG12_ROMCU